MSPVVAEKPDSRKLQALLAAAGAGRAESTEQSAKALDHDWRKPLYFGSAGMAQLRTFAEAIASSVTARSAEAHGGGFKIVAESISQHFASEFSHTDQEQTATDYYLPFAVEPSEAQSPPATLQPGGLVGAPAETATAWIRQLLADTGSQDEQSKDLSQLEKSLLHDAMSVFVKSLADSYQSWRFQPGAIVRGRFALECDETTELCKIAFDVGRDGSEQHCKAYLLLPCARLEQVVGTAERQSDSLSPADVPKALTGHLMNMDLTVTVTLGSTALTFGQLMDLAVGDVLLLDKKVTDHIDVTAEGIGFFKARPAKCDGAYAVLITQPAYKYTANS